MLDDQGCQVRLELSDAVVAAAKLAYRASADYNAAQAKRTADIGACPMALSEARARERAVERALPEHVEQHGRK